MCSSFTLSLPTGERWKSENSSPSRFSKQPQNDLDLSLSGGRNSSVDYARHFMSHKAVEQIRGRKWRRKSIAILLKILLSTILLNPSIGVDPIIFTHRFQTENNISESSSPRSPSPGSGIGKRWTSACFFNNFTL